MRFPKGKKVKPGDEVVGKGKAVDDGQCDLTDPHLAAKERANRRNQLTFGLCSEESRGVINDISTAEETYKVPLSLHIPLVIMIMFTKLSI